MRDNARKLDLQHGDWTACQMHRNEGERRSLPARFVGAYALAALPVSLFLPNVTAYFVADDWPILARNIHAWEEGLRLFTATRFGWYRPLFDLWIALNWEVFGLNPAGYHAFVFVLYVLVAVGVGLLAALLSGERWAGVLSTFLFALNGAHAEPVLWIAAANEVLAGFFVVGSLLAYVQFRRSGRGGWLVVAWLGYLLGLASKETAVFLPLALLLYDAWLYRPAETPSRWRRFAPAGGFLLTGAIFTILRLRAGSPYSAAVGVPRIAANLAYYVAVEGLALPDNYGYLTSLPLWRQAPGLPLLTVGLAVAALAVLAGVLRKSAGGRRDGRLRRALGFSVAWALLALAPVLLTATGRTAFLSSVGVAWGVSLLIVLAWRPASRRGLRRWVLAALVLFASAHLAVSAYRAYWWRQAGETSRSVVAQLDDLLSEQGDESVWLVGLPDHVRHAYVFRNAFPQAGALLSPGREIHAVLDSDLGTPQALCTDDCTIYWYEDGILTRRP